MVLMKPALDTRFGATTIRSRAGLEIDADILLAPNSVIAPQVLTGAACVLVDEAQFLSEQVIDQLRRIAYSLDIPVICYGLRADFTCKLFTGSRRLFEVADTIEEVKTTCTFCNRKATTNLKHLNGVAVADGPSIELGGEERFLPACFGCYEAQLAKFRARESIAANE